MTHSFHPSILRKYDIRGVVGETLFPQDAHATGLCFGDLARREGVETVAVCRDGRLSSPALEESLIQGLRAAGVHVVRLGMGPTPLLYFAVKGAGESIGAGVMITGSHNDKTYNGFKMTLKDRPIWGADIEAFQDQLPHITPSKTPGTLRDLDLRDAYMDRLIKGMDLNPTLRVVWDCGNGAAGELVQTLTQKIPGTHTLIHETVDGTFPNHHPDPTIDDNMEDLRQAVLREGADLGIGFDGDGDRIGVLDHTGHMIYGDQLMVPLAEDVLKEAPGAQIILDIKSSTTVVEAIREMGGTPILCPTGHSSIKALMKKTGALLAGELSGHVFFAHQYYGYDDALYAALRLLKILSNRPLPLKDMLAHLPQTFKTTQLKIPCPDHEKFLVMDRLKQALDPSSFMDLDGIRMESPKGWWLLRASNTEAALVARIEAYSKESLHTLTHEVEALLKTENLFF